MSTRRNTTAPELFAPLHVAVVESPIGKLWVESDGELITRLSFEPLFVRQAKLPKLLTEAQHQLEAYFKGQRKSFSLPVQRKGSRFQQLVWTAINDLPYGKTSTYGAVGRQIGGKANARTVGQACGSASVPLIVPCHRLLASNGLLTGYVGGLWRKKWLLQHEGALARELF